jgi:Bacterial SH3 domain
LPVGQEVALLRRLAFSVVVGILFSTSAFAAEQCRVADPTGTLLNVRTIPYGKIVGALTNGTTVTVIDSSSTNGKPWAYVTTNDDHRLLGWVFRDYLDCNRANPVEASARPWLQSYCQMDSCSWTRINEVSKVLENSGGTLYRVQTQSCVKDYPQGAEYPKAYSCKSTEISFVDNLAIYCGIQRPAIAHMRDNGWTVSHLSFDDQNDYHAIHWDNRLYFLICHSFDIDAAPNSVGLERVGSRFGYHPIDLSKDPDNITVKTIEEVSDH